LVNVATGDPLAALSVIGGSAKPEEFWENSPPLSNFGALLAFFPQGLEEEYATGNAARGQLCLVGTGSWHQGANS
jgi:hypothetical protein